MEKELQLQLAQVLGLIKDGVVSSKDFAMEQLPDIAIQYILFNQMYLSSIMVGVIGFISLVAYLAIKFEKTSDYSKEGRGYFIGAMVSIAPLIIFFFNLKSFFMVWFAPKLFLLQGIAGLVGK